MIWSEHQASRWVSSGRIEPFLRRARGDYDLACELYVWHAELGGACHAHVHHFEVLLRNAIDAAVVGNTRSSEWLLDRTILAGRGLREVEKARQRLEDRLDGDPRFHGDLVAALQLGFWRAMFAKQYEGLWRSAIHTGFPHRGAGQERKELGNRLEAIRKFRNRVAHHDSLLSVDVRARLREMDTVARAIDPDAANFIAGHSTVEKHLRACPCPKPGPD